MAVWRDGGRPAASPLLGSPSDFFPYLDFIAFHLELPKSPSLLSSYPLILQVFQSEFNHSIISIHQEIQAGIFCEFYRCKIVYS